MVRQKQWLYLATLSFLLSLKLPIAPVDAQSKVRYIPPTDVGTPKRTVGGLTRSRNCTDVSCLIAIAPGISEEDPDRYLLTVLERPTFYFSLPQIEGRAYFKLYKESKGSTPREIVYRAVFDISTESGVIGFDLPEDASALIVNQGYQWEFMISSYKSREETVSGYVKRVALSADLVKQLNTDSPLERASVYAKAGIWLDTVRTLANLRLAQPQNPELVQEWQELLKSVQLVKIAEQPLIGWYMKK